MTAIAKQDIRTTVLGLIDLAQSFGLLLSEETKALRRADFRTVDTLQHAKKTMADRYNATVSSLSNRRDEIARLDLSTREQMVRVRTSFTVLLDENMRALEATKASAARLSERILTVARHAVAHDMQTNYSAKGQTQAYKTASLSLNVDQRL